MATYKTEFRDPDADIEGLVAQLPATFEDTSWRNDMCPSWSNDEYRIWVDFKEEARREFCGRGHRFIVVPITTDETGEQTLGDQDLLATDDWSEVVELVRNL